MIGDRCDRPRRNDFILSVFIVSRDRSVDNHTERALNEHERHRRGYVTEQLAKGASPSPSGRRS